MSAATEKEVESAILDYLATVPGCFAFKINTTGIFDPKRRVMRTIKNRHQHTGTSDILGTYRGQFFAIEVKRSASHKATDRQVDFLQKVDIAGGIAFVAWSVDQVQEFILRLSNQRMKVP